MSNHNDNNFSPYMDDFREMIIFKKVFLSDDKEKFISNILADHLKADEKFIFKNKSNSYNFIVGDFYNAVWQKIRR